MIGVYLPAQAVFSRGIIATLGYAPDVLCRGRRLNPTPILQAVVLGREFDEIRCELCEAEPDHA